MSETPPVTSPPNPRPPRRWAWVVMGLIVAVGMIGGALYLAGVIPPKGRAGLGARGQLLQLGAALRQYALANGEALPDQVPAMAGSAGSSVMYRAVTPSGERLKYESFGERVVAWTEPDERGRRLVLLNSLDEAGYVPADQLDLNEQRRLDAGGGALNRVRKVSIVEEDEEAASDEPTTAPATAESTSAPTTAPATQSSR